MKKRKYLLLVNILFVLLMPVPIVAEDSPDAKEVLHRFAEARKNFSSFILETESETTSNYPGSARSRKEYEKTEYRFDGTRSSYHKNRWGKVNTSHPKVSKDEPLYFSQLWDGENQYSYGRRAALSEPGIVVIIRGKDPGGVPKRYTTFLQNSDDVGPTMGYIAGGEKRIDELLSQAERLEMKQEELGGIDCYVIEAVVKKYGKYTLWIDPTHDYHIVKSHVHQKKGDFIDGREITKNRKVYTTLEISTFQQIGGLWFPKQLKTATKTVYESDLRKQSKITDITSIVLNPDHDALKSFIPDDIPNGATVLISVSSLSAKHIWRDGKVVDDKGNVIMDCIPKK